MSAIDLLKRPLSSVLLAATLSLPLVGSGCAAEVGDTEAVVDDSGAEVDETSVKEDSSVRPHGRFQVPEFEIYGGESDVRLGYTYALDVNDQGAGTRDYGVPGPSDGAMVGRRDVTVKFTRSGSKRYIRLTDVNDSETPNTVRFEYKMSRGSLRLRAENSSRWFTMEPGELAEASFIEDVKAYYTESQDDANDAPAFDGDLPFNVELSVDHINYIWGDDYPAVVREVSFTPSRGREQHFLMVCGDNDGGGTRDFYTMDGLFIARGEYSESTEFRWSN